MYKKNIKSWKIKKNFEKKFEIRSARPPKSTPGHINPCYGKDIRDKSAINPTL